MLRASLAAMLIGTLAFGISCTGSGGASGFEPLPISGKIYYVDNGSKAAADTNPGTEAKPWKTLTRAGTAKELKPGDAVFFKSGVYRENMSITASGAPGKPVVFAAAPGAKVTIKGSEIITAEWQKVTPEPNVKEPYPNAFQNVWKVKLGEEFFADQPTDKAQRKVYQVISEDFNPLLPVGPDSKETAGGDGKWVVVEPVGKGLEDLRTGTYYFDRDRQELYTKVGGEPGWISLEVSVRTGVLQIQKVHDMILRGLEFRHCRGNLAGMGDCQRVLIEDCKFDLAAFGNFGAGGCTDCTVRRCDFSWAGNNGFGLSNTLDFTVEDCTIMFNNYRRYGAGWHDGGMKNIPGNKRTTIQRCEVAYNYSGGVWFDMLNVDTRILDNVFHHNVGDGVGFEVNYGPNVIAGNLCYANGGYGIGVVGHPPAEYMHKMARGEAGDSNEKVYVPQYLKDWIDFPDQNLYIVNNTLCENGNGIGTSHSDGTPEFGQSRQLANVQAMNNLFLHNGHPEDPVGKYVDLRFWLHVTGDGMDAKRGDDNCHSDYNAFLAGVKPMLKPHYHFPAWGKEHTLAEWQKLFGEDLHSRVVPVHYWCGHDGFEQMTSDGLDFGAPLPDSVTKIWKPGKPRQVGANITRWPG